MAKYPSATFLPSRISHPDRPETRGIVIHWTSGHEPGDIVVLRGPNVDVQFYVAKSGKVYQFLDSGSQAWHAFHTANSTCIGIEHEGNGEPWTDAQLAASAKLSAWICRLYSIPVKHVFPPSDWHGLFGHADLSAGHVDGNDHTDSVPKGTGWTTYLNAIKGGISPVPTPDVPPANASVDDLIEGAMKRVVVNREQFDSIGTHNPPLADYCASAEATAQGALNYLQALRKKT